MIRAQSVILPLLRDALPGVEVVSWIPDVDQRSYPLLFIRRQGGTRNATRPDLLDRAIIQMTSISADGLAEAEDLYGDALARIFRGMST